MASPSAAARAILAGFDGRTAMQLVQEDRADDVLRYIDAIDAGMHA